MLWTQLWTAFIFIFPLEELDFFFFKFALILYWFLRFCCRKIWAQFEKLRILWVFFGGKFKKHEKPHQMSPFGLYIMSLQSNRNNWEIKRFNLRFFFFMGKDDQMCLPHWVMCTEFSPVLNRRKRKWSENVHWQLLSLVINSCVGTGNSEIQTDVERVWQHLAPLSLLWDWGFKLNYSYILTLVKCVCGY